MTPKKFLSRLPSILDHEKVGVGKKEARHGSFFNVTSVLPGAMIRIQSEKPWTHLNSGLISGCGCGGTEVDAFESSPNFNPRPMWLVIEWESTERPPGPPPVFLKECETFARSSQINRYSFFFRYSRVWIVVSSISSAKYDLEIFRKLGKGSAFTKFRKPLHAMKNKMQCWSPWATSFPVTLLEFAPCKWIYFILMFAADWTSLAPFLSVFYTNWMTKGQLRCVQLLQ